MPRPRAHRAQDRHLAPPLVEAGEDGGEHAEQARQHHERRDDHQRGIGDADQVPQLRQRDARHDGEQRLLAVFVDRALQTEGHHAVLHAHHERGDRVGREVHGARRLGVHAPAREGAHAALPIDMDGGDGLEAHMHGAVDRRAGAREDADDAERLVLVLREAHIAEAVRDDDGVAQLVAERARDLGAEHRVVEVRERLARFEGELTAAGEAVVAEVVEVGAEHAVAAVRIAERQRDGPRDIRAARHLLVGVPADIGGGVADAEHGVQQQVDLAGARADDEVDAGDGVGEAVTRSGAQLLDAEQQRDADRDGAERQQRRGAAVGERAQRERQGLHGGVIKPRPRPVRRRG